VTKICGAPYKRQRELYQPGSLPLTSLLKGEQLRTEQARVEEAHDTPARSVCAGRPTTPRYFRHNPLKRPRAMRRSTGALEAERTMLQKELTRELNGETEFTGTLLLRGGNRRASKSARSPS